jgi:hypothetical protein
VRAWLQAGRSDTAGPPWSAAAAALAQDEMRLRSVRTQCFTLSSKFVDLELRFGTPTGALADDVIIWVEVKHGTDPHEYQLSSYLADAAVPGTRSSVVLLAPRASYPFRREPPMRVAQRTWQETGAICDVWLADCDDDVARFLTQELVYFLHQEGLMDPPALTPAQFQTLADYRGALASLASAWRAASSYIEQAWGVRTGPKRGPVRWDTVVGAWETHIKAPAGQTPADWGGAFIDWNLMHSDRALEDSRGGAPVFIAGVGISHPNSLFTAAWVDWQAQLRARGDFVVMTSGDYDRFVRVAYPEDVLTGDTVAQQGESLGRWVVQTFQALHDARTAQSAA